MMFTVVFVSAVHGVLSYIHTYFSSLVLLSLSLFLSLIPPCFFCEVFGFHFWPATALKSTMSLRGRLQMVLLSRDASSRFWRGIAPFRVSRNGEPMTFAYNSTVPDTALQFFSWKLARRSP
jgi:hypothetical protein